MNQDEITKDIKHADGMIDNLGLQIVWWKCRSLGLQEKQDQLAEVEKPEWQQGDYGLAIQKRGTDSGVYSFIFVGDRVYYNSGTYDEKTVLSDGSFYEYVRLGNVFDDIKALAKPLKGFIEGGVRYSINTGHGIHAGMIQIGMDFWTIQNVKRHILDLQRLVFTAEQEAAK